jgi:predicted  nucleic acid-binding Zn-ribbon protein
MRTPDERIAEARALQAEAEAEKARGEAKRAAAEAERAQIEVTQARQQVTEYGSAASTRQREAEAAKATAEAESAAAKVRQEMLAALIPDFSKIADSTLDVGQGPPLWGTFLLAGALSTAADKVAANVNKVLADESRVLVTNEPDLASSDAVYRDVTSGLDQLTRAADDLLDSEKELTINGLDAAGAIASSVPAVLSLLSAKRAQSTSSVSPSDLAATAALARSLIQVRRFAVIHSDFRLVTDEAVYSQMWNLSAKRQQLSTEHTKLRQAGSEVVSARASLIEALIAAITGFVAGIRTVPEGMRRSALASAALHHALHKGPSRFTHVLLVKAQVGTAQQLVDNRPLWFKDKFSAIVDASLAYILINTEDSRIQASGIETSVHSAYGNIGQHPKLERRA